MERRLAAILAVDMVGYSRLMEEDETGTLATLKDLRSELVDPLIVEHHGRNVKLMGDGALVEFASVVDAVACAVAIQRTLAGRNTEVRGERRIELRIGVHLGDVIVEGDDIYGDGVNVASRLEALAEPGGVCLSQQAYDQVVTHLKLPLVDLGPQNIKNIARPVRAYRVQLAQAAGTVAKAPGAVTGKLRLIGVAVFAVLGAAGLLALLGVLREPEIAPASRAQMAFPLPDEPSIAVLPFDNFTGDPGQAHIADGMTETITSTLSRIPHLFVIARNSASVYDGKATKVQRVAEELGVRYVLEGSVQQAGNRIRVAVQLIDALNGHHLWTESYDRDFEDLFQLQDEIALKTAVELQVKLTSGEEARVLSRTTDDVRAWALYQKALASFFTFSAEGTREARRFAQSALDEDPKFADAMIIIGFTHLVDARSGYTSSPQESLRLAVEYAEEARGLAPDAPNLYNLMQSIHRFRGDFDEAMAAGERAIQLSPNSEISLLATTMTSHLAGQFDRSVELAEKAIRLSPHHRSTGLIWLGRSFWFQGEYERSKEAAREGINRAESEFIAALHLLNLAGAQVETGDLESARQAVDQALQKAPQLSLSFLRSAADYKSDAHWERFASALRSAGLPE